MMHDVDVLELKPPSSCSDNFQPESIDPSKPGSIEVKKGKDSTSVTVARACTQVCAFMPCPHSSNGLLI